MPTQQASLEQLLDQLVEDVKKVLRDKKAQASESSEEVETIVLRLEDLVIDDAPESPPENSGRVIKKLTSRYRLTEIPMTFCDPKAIDLRLAELEPNSPWRKAVDGLAHYKYVIDMMSIIREKPRWVAYNFYRVFPNFEVLYRRVMQIMYLKSMHDSYFKMRPILLYGPPGCGKTKAVKEICRLLHMDLIAIDLSSSGDHTKITGTSQYWKGAGPGELALALSRSQCGNPMILFDEIDKVLPSHQGNPLDRILMLTEPETAQEFKDDFIGVPMDLRSCTIVAIANSIDNLPEPFLSRFECIEIQHLDLEGRKVMVETVYNELLHQENFKNFLEEKLDSDIVKQLAESGLLGRDLYRAVFDTVSCALESIPLENAAGWLPLRVKAEHVRLGNVLKSVFT